MLYREHRLNRSWRLLKLTGISSNNSHALHSTITEKLHKYTDVKEERIKIWQLTPVRIIPPVLSTAGSFPYTLRKFQTELFKLRPALNILMQKAVMPNVYCTVRKFSAEQ
jgi:hypothetical protein